MPEHILPHPALRCSPQSMPAVTCSDHSVKNPVVNLAVNLAVSPVENPAVHWSLPNWMPAEKQKHLLASFVMPAEHLAEHQHFA